VSQRAILVTGGTGTLGGALVKALCAQGHLVVANFARDERRARCLQEETNCQLFRADVSDEAQVASLFAALPPLFAVVHAAGIARDALLLRQTPQNWHETLRANATSSFLIARGALQNLEDDGRLIFVASRVGERGAVGQGAYAASKAAMLGLMKSAAREGAGRLCVNAICPPFVPSAMANELDENHVAALAAQSLSGRVGSANSFVGAVLWLLGEAGAEISGQVIHCDDRLS
jgi:3-oxoacyl-[acyl-carrier protein] reductase